MFVRRQIVVAIMAIGLCAASEAYDMGGHHYTLNAIFASSDSRPVARAAPEKLIQAFCAELPDLSLELDAITQRNHVLFDAREWLWGAMGRCSTDSCTHMVASQFYLHALTGTNTAPVRTAARSMVRAIDAEIVTVGAQPSADKQQRLVNLWCERGLAAHLLGDTFAHAVMAEPQRLYPTGLGHTRDMRVPDYMLARDDLSLPVTTRWSAWVRSAAVTLSDAKGAEPVIKLADGVPSKDKDDHGEELLRLKLMAYTPETWNPYSPVLINWNTPRTPSTKWWIFGRLADAYARIILQNSCQTQLSRFASQVDLKSMGGKLPQCDAVWAGYRDKALVQFDRVGIRPDCCEMEVLQKDRLEYGCRNGMCRK